MKQIKLIILALIVGGSLSSCGDDFLETFNPNEQTSDNFWKTEDELMSGLNAAYRPLRFNGVYNRWLHVLYISRSDEGYCLSPNPDFQSYSNFLTRNNDGTEGVFFPWLDMYKGIFWANQVLDAAPNVPMEDEELRQRILGQAYFLRGIEYFHIAGVFGRGPLTLTSNAEDNAPITEQHEIYLQSKSDFDEAQKRLPAQWEESKDLGRITKGAALGMLVKVAAQLREWNDVKTYCEAIFALKSGTGQPLYSLVANYQDNFTATNENNAESLFEIQYRTGILDGVELGCQRAKFLGVPVDGAAWDDATANDKIKPDWEKEKNLDNKVDPRLKVTFSYYDAASPNDLYYGKTWTTWGLSQSKVYWKKYTNYNTQTFEDYNSGINYRVIRLADIYLMYAEALNELGQTSAAYEYINKVRARASVNLPKLENSTVFTGIGNDQEKMRKQIMHERVTELTGECWRWLDLERWGYLDTPENIAYLKSRDSEFNNFVIGKNNRFPIPYRELSLVKGLEQNPGY
jgi:hypothetical protein